jgi:hypothetical protein
MSIRLDPRRLGTLKHLAGEAGIRPGDLVRQWVEERIDAQRTPSAGRTLEDRVAALEERLAALSGEPAAPSKPMVNDAPPHPDAVEAEEAVETPVAEAADPDETAAVATTADEPAAPAAAATRRRRASAAPTGRVALHDEMIAVLSERGPMTAGELAAAIAERGRYAPPRSGRELDAAMVSQRASNPTYRSRFLRREGRIGLAESG